MNDLLAGLAVLLSGLSVGLLVAFIGQLYFRIPLIDHTADRRFPENNKSYPDRWRLYQALARWRMGAKRAFLPKSMRSGVERLWVKSGSKPAEMAYFIAKLEIIFFFSILMLVLASALTRSVGFGIFVALPIFLFWALTYYRFKDRVTNRIRQIERELPYALDLLAMMLFGGGTIYTALDSMTSMPVRTPLMDELRGITGSLRMGKSFSESLHALSERVGSNTVKSMVLAIEQGERLGTPLHDVLKLQAQTIRNKRILNAEEKAHQAGVMVFIPASLVMLALMIILLAPSILKMFRSAQ